MKSVHWRGLTLVIIFAIWSAFVWYKGYNYGAGENQRVQARIDEATHQNQLLNDALEGANKELLNAETINKQLILESDKKHQNREVGHVPASQAKEEEDYYGTKYSDEFAKQLEDMIGKGVLREKD